MWWTLWTSWAAARPSVPNLLLVAYGGDALPAQGPGVPGEPLTPPGTVRVPVGRHNAMAAKEGLLLRRVSEQDWRLVRPQAPVLSGELLLTLPGYRSEILLSNGLRLELVGSLPELSRNQVLESAVQLAVNPQAELEVSLQRGRIVIANRPDGPALIRLHFGEQVWDLRLLQPATQVGIELTSRLTRGMASWVPRTELKLITTGGDVELKRSPTAAPQQLAAGKLLVWDSQIDFQGADDLLLIPLPEPPPWVLKKETVPEEVRTATFQFQQRLLDKLDKEVPEGQELPWILLAFEESLAGNRPLEQRLALFSYGALDQIRVAVAALDDPDRPRVREAALHTLWHWLGRQPEQHTQLRAILHQAGYSGQDAEIALQLLQGFDEANRRTYEILLILLQHGRLTIRELAYINLREMVPTTKPLPYDPAGTQEERDRAVERLRRTLLPKP
jgi:hypothetical protein